LVTASLNLTTNELTKKQKYGYLQVNVNGKKKSLFDKGLVNNCKYYFYLTQPPFLETEGYYNAHGENIV
jgi:hypothetical protein